MTSRGGGPRNRGGNRGSNRGGPSGGAGRRPRGSNAGPPSSGGCGFVIPLLPVLFCLALARAATARLTGKGEVNAMDKTDFGWA